MKTLYRITLLFAFVLLLSDFAFAQTGREQGIDFYQKGKYQEAVEILQKSVEADETNQELWLYLGMSFAKLKNEKEAINSFKKAGKLPIKESVGNEKVVKLTAKPAARYTDSARQNYVQGTVALAIEFGADGTIKFIFPYQKLSNGLTENSIEAARKVSFEPATKDGKPMPEIRIIKYSFRIY